MDLADLHTPADTASCHITTFGPPAARHPIHLSPTHADFVDQEIHKLWGAGVMMTGATPQAAAMFPVPKPHSTKLLLVINYRALNAQTIWDSMPIPHVRNVIARMG